MVQTEKEIFLHGICQISALFLTPKCRRISRHFPVIGKITSKYSITEGNVHSLKLENATYYS